MVNAARYYKRVVQVGMQGRSHKNASLGLSALSIIMNLPNKIIHNILAKCIELMCHFHHFQYQLRAQNSNKIIESSNIYAQILFNNQICPIISLISSISKFTGNTKILAESPSVFYITQYKRACNLTSFLCATPKLYFNTINNEFSAL